MFTYLRNEIVVIAQYYFSLIAIAFAVGAFFFIKRFPHWMRILRASAWPTTSGQIEIADVSSFGGQAIAELGYSFAMEGTTYSGYYSHQVCGRTRGLGLCYAPERKTRRNPL
jgi:hypothetical protein